MLNIYCSRDSDLEGKLARVVVHATGVHEGEHVPHGVGLQHLLTGGGADATVGQCCRHHRDTFCCYLHWATLRRETLALHHQRLVMSDTVFMFIPSDVMDLALNKSQHFTRLISIFILIILFTISSTYCPTKTFSKTSLNTVLSLFNSFCNFQYFTLLINIFTSYYNIINSFPSQHFSVLNISLTSPVLLHYL